MSGLSREEFSRVLFGTKDAMDIYAVVSGFTVDPPQAFTVKEVHEQFLDPRAVSEASIRKHLGKLQLLGAVQRTEDSPTGAHQYLREDSVFWEELVKPMADKMINRALET